MTSRYADSHSVPSGPGDARPTAMQIIKDNSLENALKDKFILMTGASSGIGIETARAIAATGARCFLGVRDLEKGSRACQDFLEAGRVELVQIDTSSLASVRKAAAECLEKTGGRLNVLINNAGIMALPTQQISVDGYEMQFATNYLGHFLLYRLLEKALLSSSTSTFNSRVVNVASAGHHAGGIVFDNMRLDDGAYEAWKAYGQSKTAMIYMTNHIERLHGNEGLHGHSLMPGGIATNLQQHVSDETKASWADNKEVTNFLKSPEQGASTTIYAALDRDWEGKGGKYLEDCHVAEVREPVFLTKYAAAHIYDEEKETRLWSEISNQLGFKP